MGLLLTFDVEKVKVVERCIVCSLVQRIASKVSHFPSARMHAHARLILPHALIPEEKYESNYITPNRRRHPQP